MKESAAVVATTTFGDIAGRLESEDISSIYSTIESVAHRSLRDYASFINARLRDEGYDAYFVGGCVRDLLLGREPKDYDIATNASPDGILQLFPGSGLVGAHFGVVLVREGPWQVEVATFRNDGEYSDGRRPDSVLFVGDPRHDVERRDFTINALLMDPETDTVIDFVGGRADLEAGVIRAIGDPLQRFEEDHLRLMRAIRFAARFGFTIEPRTFEAIRTGAALVTVVAVERVRDEINRILLEGGAHQGLELLDQSGLAEQLGLPIYPHAIERLSREKPSTVAVAWAALLLDCKDHDQVKRLLAKFRLSIHEARTALTLITNHGRINRPFESIAELKRFLRLPSHAEQMELHRLDRLPEPQVSSFSEEELSPKPLITGEDLHQMRIPQGPVYSEILRDAETAQLNGELTTRDQAIEWVATRRRTTTTPVPGT
jgi:poly(A) polymerase